MALSKPSGFAIRRNGTCLENEVDCGTTVAPFRACCPAGASCPTQYNIDCCPSSANCTQALLQDPHCANATWTLYDNAGFFCCAPGTIGYNATSTFSDGCANPGSPPEGAQLLSVVLAGQVATSSSTSPSPPTSSASSSATLPSLPSTTMSSSPLSQSARPGPSGHSHTRAAVGGAVGGAAAIVLLVSVWFFYSRKRKARNASSHLGNHSERTHEKDPSTRAPDRNELDGVIRYELPNRQAGRYPPVEPK